MKAQNEKYDSFLFLTEFCLILLDNLIGQIGICTKFHCCDVVCFT